MAEGDSPTSARISDLKLGDEGQAPSQWGAMHDVRRPRQPSWLHHPAVTYFIWAGMLCAVLLRWLNLGKQSLWVDEGFMAWVSRLSPPEIIRAIRFDTSPPLYYIMEHYWANLFGNSETALRALSTFFGTISLPVFYFLAKKILQDQKAVALAVWLFALHGMQIWYSRDARFYAVMSFLSLVSLYALILFLEKRSKALFACIALSLTAGLYIHNMMFFYVLALSAIWLIYPAERTLSQRIRELAFADLIVIVLYLPWVPGLLTQLAVVRRSFWAPTPSVTHLLETLGLIAGLRMGYLNKLPARILHQPSPVAGACLVAVTLTVCTALLITGLVRVRQNARRKTAALLLYCASPVIVVFLLSHFMASVYVDRVFISSSSVLPILFALPLARNSKARARVLRSLLGVVLLALTAISTFGILRHEKKEDWRAATDYLLRIPETKRLVAFLRGEILFDYYSSRFPGIPPPVAKCSLPSSTGDAIRPGLKRITNAADINAMKRITSAADMSPLRLAVNSPDYKEIDLVLSHEELADPNGLAFNYLKSVCILHEEQSFYGIRIIRFLTPAH